MRTEIQRFTHEDVTVKLSDYSDVKRFVIGSNKDGYVRVAVYDQDGLLIQGRLTMRQATKLATALNMISANAEVTKA